MFRPISGKAERNRHKAYLKLLLVPLILLSFFVYGVKLYCGADLCTSSVVKKPCYNMAGPTTRLDEKWKYVNPNICF
jgi:hypothetical protein